MNRIAGNSYDEGNRENELDFDPYANGFNETIIEDIFEEELKNNFKKDDVSNSLNGTIFKRALIEIMNNYQGEDKEVSDFLNKDHSSLIFHRDPHKYDSRESACSFLNKKTNGAFGEIYRENLCGYDDKIYKISDLYREYKQFLLDNKDFFSRNKNFIYTLKDFTILISRNTLIKKRGQMYKKKRIRSAIAIGLPKYLYK